MVASVEGREFPYVRVVICASEQVGDLAETIEARLRDPYPRTRVICLLDAGDPAPQLKARFSGDPRVSFRSFPPGGYGVALDGLLGNAKEPGFCLWQMGDGPNVYDQLVDPRPIHIEPEDPLEYFVGEVDEALPEAPPPDYLNVGFTRRCNYRCFFCSAEKLRSDPHQRDLPIELFYKLRPAIENAGGVDLTSPGEFLLYRKAREAMAFVAEHNLHRGLQFTTTGALLTGELMAPVASRVDQVVVSLNAGSRETYERDMGSKLWDRVLGNLRDVRKRLTRDQVTLGFVAHGENIDELPALVRLAAEIDVWHIRIAPIFVQKPEHVMRSLWFCKTKAEDLIAESRRMGESLGVIISNIHESVKQLSDAGGTPCAMPRFGSYVTPNGDVIPCCYAGRHVMGNVFRSGSFEKVWNGKKYRALRERLYFRHCAKCPNVRTDTDRLESQVALDALEASRDVLPLVSVVPTAPLSADSFAHALESLRSQTYPLWEFLVPVAGDGRDGWKELVGDATAHDPRVRAVAAQGEIGSRETFLAAAGEGKGEFVAPLDPSRAFPPNRFQVALTALSGGGDALGAVYEMPGEHGGIGLATACARRDSVPDLFIWPAGEARSRVLRLSPKAADLSPRDSRRHAALLCAHGESLLGGGHLVEAGEAFREAAQADPACVDAHTDLGVLEWMLGNPVDAIMHLSRALAIDECNCAALVNLAEIFLSIDQPGKARRVVEKASAAHPGDADVERLSAMLENRKGPVE